MSNLFDIMLGVCLGERLASCDKKASREAKIRRKNAVRQARVERRAPYKRQFWQTFDDAIGHKISEQNVMITKFLNRKAEEVKDRIDEKLNKQ